MENRYRIEEILDLSGKKAKILISGRVFHPAGGGQPGDSGTLEGKGFRADVVDCHKGDGGDILTIRIREGTLETGSIVSAFVDEERNLRLSRMHTGEHIFSRALEDLFEGLRVEKVWIGEKESTIYIKFTGEIGWDEIFHAEEKANSVIGEDLPITRDERSKCDFEEFEGVRIKWDRLEEEKIAVISIRGYDSIACSGSHVSSTGLVGGIIATGFRGSPPDWEIRFTVDRQEFLEKQSRMVRVLLRDVGCEEGKLPSVVQRLQEERRELSKKIDRVKSFVEIPWERHRCKGFDVFVFSAENFPVEVATGSMKKKMANEPDAFVLFLSRADENNEVSFVLAAGQNRRSDLRAIPRENPSLSARGGGSADWIQGVAASASISEWKDAISRKVDK